ncbi:unnamed protein product [Phytomonas sp. Hart1]|nr:unnamed protein product [Phytomonas sp. Hart1]|eukprot:CCW66231.1 unnamed protein product [Phytomonas sp. isolate Hart1]
MSLPVKQSLNILEKKLVRAARGFYDYNFRQYFLQKSKDCIATARNLSSEEQEKYLKTEGREMLKQMKRMVLVNRMYGSQPVFLDRKKDDSPITPVKKE